MATLRRLCCALLLLPLPCVPSGCSPEGAGSLDLKKLAGPPEGGTKVREFRKGDLEDR